VTMRSGTRLSRSFLTTNRPSSLNGGSPFPNAVRPIGKGVPSQVDRRHFQLEGEDGKSAQT
jgi:hypothetical protein